jgi:hypothetical protein
MALITCKQCDRKISSIVTHCPACGAQVAPIRKPLPVMTVIAVGTVCLIGLIAFGPLFDTDRRSPEDKKESLARTAAKQLIPRQLKSPSTATFAPDEEWSITKYGNDYVLSAWVDSQNSFGAMLRMQFVAVMRDEGENWRLVSFDDAATYVRRQRSASAPPSSMDKLQEQMHRLNGR